jgi:hypothetical protein
VPRKRQIFNFTPIKLTLLGRLAGASTTLAWKCSAGCQGVRTTKVNHATGRKDDEVISPIKYRGELLISIIKLVLMVISLFE